MRKWILAAVIICVSATYAGFSAGKNAVIILDSFNTGQVSPKMEARQDYAKYNSSLRTLENFVINPLGPVQRRPGTKYIATAKTGTPRMIKFEYSTDDVYAIEMGDEYMRFYRNGGQILTDASAVYEIATGFDSSELSSVRYAQSDNWLYMVDGNDIPQVLTRTAHNAWTISDIDQVGGPFQQNLDEGITLQVGSTGTTAGYDYYRVNSDSSISVYDVKWYAQTFTASQSYTANGVQIYALRYGLPGILTVSIKATTAGKPSGADLAVGTIDANDFVTSYGGKWEEVTFAAPVALTSGTVYAVVVRALGGSTNNKVRWRGEQTPGTYDGGASILSADSGSVWTIGTGDFNFDVVADGVGNSSETTLNASAEIFDDDGHVGSLWQLTHEIDAETIEGRFWVSGDSNSTSNIFVYEDQTFTVTTGGDWWGTFNIERSYDDGITWLNVKPFASRGNFNVLYNGIEGKADALYRVTMRDQMVTGHMARHGEGECDYTFATDSFLKNGIVKITTVTDPNTAEVAIITSIGSTDATSDWAEGCWSNYRGWPKTVEFHQQRAVYGGSTTYPNAIWFSQTGADYYDDFSTGTLATDAFWVQIQGQNPIRWLLSGDYLLVGTSGSVGRYGKQGLAITPASPSYLEQSQNGAAEIQSIMAGDMVIYVERNQRRIREFGYNFQFDRYTTPDLTLLSEEITDPCVVEIAFQGQPYPTLWCLLGNGEIATLSYYRGEAVVGWGEQNTDGDFKSLVAMPGSGTTPGDDRWTETEVWAVVERDVDSVATTFIEQFTPIEWGDDYNDCWFLDCALSTGDELGGGSSIFTGLDHLIGETVTVYADANAVGTALVAADGSITMAGTYTNLTAGLPYTSKFETFPLRLSRKIPTARISDFKIMAVNADLYKTKYLKYSLSNEAALTTADFGSEFKTSTIDFSRFVMPYGSREKYTVYIESAQPLPLSVRALISEATYYPPF